MKSAVPTGRPEPPNLDLRLAGLRRQKVAIDVLATILEEDRLTPVAPLGHVVRKARDHEAGETGRGENFT
jgi:hypothetical protein